MVNQERRMYRLFFGTDYNSLSSRIYLVPLANLGCQFLFWQSFDPSIANGSLYRVALARR
jgi:hypothetical protein